MLILSGGTGTPKLLEGLKKLLPENEITVVVNTAEDMWVSGNLVTPDIDTVLYLFSGKLDTDKWWGIKNDTFITYEFLRSLGHNEILKLGDQDRAVNIMRSDLLRTGYSLTEATQIISKALGIRSKILPMSDDPVSTLITTSTAKMHFQEFWVKEQGKPAVVEVSQEGIEKACISPAVLEALEKEENVLIGPSNPITSIGPILTLKGMKDILKKKKVVAVSPIIGKEAVSGPAGKLMAARGLEVSSAGVVDCYKDILDIIILDERDDYGISALKNAACKVLITDTLMKNVEKSISLARFVVDAFKYLD
ncbi:MAG: 2-phospho-L-lactate transferase [Methanomethylovorans sp.]|jgi:LPPG:FO 2-phospho-L-lactate transferase|nr:2-phospho-L-lactate transferase [Methanomethylovorans sp.]